MKVINDLVVCEVPKEAYDFRANGAAGFAYSLPNSGYWHIVDTPCPCTIIGLASEIDGLHEIEILLAADYDLEVSLFELMHGNELHTTETTDLLFLKRLP